MKLKAARERKKLTQAALAVAAKADQRTISKLELHEIKEPSYRLVVRICRVLDIDPECIDEFRVGK